MKLERTNEQANRNIFNLIKERRNVHLCLDWNFCVSYIHMLCHIMLVSFQVCPGQFSIQPGYKLKLVWLILPVLQLLVKLSSPFWQLLCLSDSSLCKMGLTGFCQSKKYQI